MTWVAVGVGVASLAAGAMGASASKKAAATQAAAIDRGTRAQVSQDAQNRADNSQFLGTGIAANKRLAQLLGIKPTAPTWETAAAQVLNDHKARLGVGYVPGETNMDTVNAETQRVFDNMQRDYQTESQASAGTTPEDIMAMDPGYQFRMDQGLNATKNAAVARGGLDSGATLKALTRFGQDYASGEFGSIYNRLAGVSGAGQTATGQNQASGTNMANNVSNLATEGGNARAAGIVGGANAWGSGVSGVAGAANNYQNNEILRKLLAGRNSGSNPFPNYGGQNLAQDDYSAGYYGTV